MRQGLWKKPGPRLLSRMTYWREVLERQIEFGSGEYREFGVVIRVADY